MACLPALRSMTWDNGLMQGFGRMDRELTDAEMLAGHLVPAGSMFAFLAAHRAEVFPDAGYADLFAAFGRPSLPATRMAAVLALQALHDYSDRETAEAVRFDVRWKAACGLAVDDAGFDPSSLVYWRGRISRSERPHRVNEAVRKIVEQTGVLKGRRRRAVDSTILADGRWRIARRVAEDRTISTVDPDARHTRKSPEARRDGYRAHVAACPQTGIITDEKLTKAAGTENSDPAVAEEFLAAGGGDGDGTVQAAPQAAGSQDSGADGGDDQNEPLAWYGDSAYGTGDLRGAIAGAGHHAVIKPKPLRPPVEGGFDIDDFTVDERA